MIYDTKTEDGGFEFGYYVILLWILLALVNYIGYRSYSNRYESVTEHVNTQITNGKPIDEHFIMKMVEMNDELLMAQFYNWGPIKLILFSQWDDAKEFDVEYYSNVNTTHNLPKGKNQ